MRKILMRKVLQLESPKTLLDLSYPDFVHRYDPMSPDLTNPNHFVQRYVVYVIVASFLKASALMCI